jgi:predicted nicotinamide N-methyase
MPDAPLAVRRPVPVPSSALLARLAPLTPVPGRPDLVAHHAPDVFALWQAWEEECGAQQAVPFWATVWPAAQLLARVVQAEPAWVRGQTVLDLGCGSGVAGIAAVYAGATRVVAHDIDPVALALAAKNAMANAVDLLLQGPPLLHRPCPAHITCILVGDLFYERAAAAALWAWLRTAHQRGGPGPHRRCLPTVCPYGRRAVPAGGTSGHRLDLGGYGDADGTAPHPGCLRPSWRRASPVASSRA